MEKNTLFDFIPWHDFLTSCASFALSFSRFWEIVLKVLFILPLVALLFAFSYLLCSIPYFFSLITYSFFGVFPYEND